MKTLIQFLALFTFHAHATELSIPSDLGGTIGKCDLGATLLLPKQKAKALVVFVHGSGPTDRDETVAGYKPFRDIAERLTKDANVATLRFDKRAVVKDCVPALVKNPSLLPSHFISDVRAVVRYARTRPEIAKLPLVLLGHSEGVNFVTELAAEPEIDAKAVVLIAGLGKYPIDQTLLRQYREALPAMAPDEAEKLRALIKQGEDFFARLHAGKAAADEFYSGAYTGYWREWIAITARGAQSAAAIKVPSLLLQGSDDHNVTADDFEALRIALGKTGVATTSEMFPGLNHLMTRADSLLVAEEVHAALKRWFAMTFASSARHAKVAR